MNMVSMTFDRSQQRTTPKDEAQLNIYPIAVTLEISHAERSPLKDGAELNIPLIAVTLETSHAERSPLKDMRFCNM
jgi:hypothetical protein